MSLSIPGGCLPGRVAVQCMYIVVFPQRRVQIAGQSCARGVVPEGVPLNLRRHARSGSGPRHQHVRCRQCPTAATSMFGWKVRHGPMIPGATRRERRRRSRYPHAREGTPGNADLAPPCTRWEDTSSDMRHMPSSVAHSGPTHLSRVLCR